LVEGEYRGRVKAIKLNHAALQELEKIEDRTRRKDVVIDDEALYSLYDGLLPKHVVSDAALEKWYRQASENDKLRLVFSEEQLKLDNAASFDAGMFPDTLENNGIKFPLTYSFKPGAAEDGISINVPARAARQVTAARLEKLVPGLLKEKCTQLIKNLPRTLRKHFVPVPDTVNKIFEKVESSTDPLLESLAAQLKYLTGVNVPIEAWNVDLLDDHLRLNIRVLDDNGKLITQGRDLVKVVEKADEYLKDKPDADAQDSVRNEQEVLAWDFDLPESIEVSQAGIRLNVYPCLIDKKK
ncbi:DUF3418 domain-containing protein, partial [Oleiphilus sp. HI0066]